MAGMAGTGGVAAVAVNVVDSVVVILPPLLFCLAWFIARRRTRRGTTRRGV